MEPCQGQLQYVYNGFQKLFTSLVRRIWPTTFEVKCIRPLLDRNKRCPDFFLSSLVQTHAKRLFQRMHI